MFARNVIRAASQAKSFSRFARYSSRCWSAKQESIQFNNMVTVKRNYTVSTSNPNPDVMKNVRLLKTLGASPQEVQSYLNMYLSVDNRSFGVIKVGGGVIQDNLDDLVNSISTLTKFGLIPIIVHGAGPQMNSTLQKMGIPSAYDEGLRITTLDILKVARKIFVEANFRLVNIFSIFRKKN